MNNKYEIELTEEQITNISQKVASLLTPIIIKFSSFKKMTLKDVEAYLSIDRLTVYRLIKEDGFPKPVKVGRVLRFEKDEIDGWLEEKKLKAHESK
ncbi:MAG: helix-turn-helix domain-containing protein [Endomicrobium sp.]|jgi:excisionase family DNA binding protein|nr:helix-turn-helix domain-containing protein [Endomicrobium sp.]